MSDLPDVTDEDRDLVFIEEYLQREGQDDAAVIACRKAGIRETAFAIDVTARRTYNRLAPAIKVARKYFQKRQPTDITRESLLADLDEIFRSTVLTHDHAAANANRKLVAQLAGLLTENITVTHRHDVKLLSDDELAKIAQKQLKVIDADMKDVTPLGIGHVKSADPT